MACAECGISRIGRPAVAGPGIKRRKDKDGICIFLENACIPYSWLASEKIKEIGITLHTPVPQCSLSHVFFGHFSQL